METDFHGGKMSQKSQEREASRNSKIDDFFSSHESGNSNYFLQNIVQNIQEFCGSKEENSAVICTFIVE